MKVERTNDMLKQEGGKIKYIQKDSIPALLSDLCIDDLTARSLQNDHLAIGRPASNIIQVQRLSLGRETTQ